MALDWICEVVDDYPFQVISVFINTWVTLSHKINLDLFVLFGIKAIWIHKHLLFDDIRWSFLFLLHEFIIFIA